MHIDKNNMVKVEFFYYISSRETHKTSDIHRDVTKCTKAFVNQSYQMNKLLNCIDNKFSNSLSYRKMGFYVSKKEKSGNITLIFQYYMVFRSGEPREHMPNEAHEKIHLIYEKLR